MIAIYSMATKVEFDRTQPDYLKQFQTISQSNTYRFCFNMGFSKADGPMVLTLSMTNGFGFWFWLKLARQIVSGTTS